MSTHRNKEIQTITQFIKFALVGATGTLISLSILYSLTELLSFQYWMALPIGYFIGITNNFLLNRRFTFLPVEKSFLTQYIEYIVSMLFGALGYTLSTIILTEIFTIWYFLSAVLSVGVSTTIDFALSKIWVFRKRDKTL
ncbi:MAG: GtrA family protein [Candidatus Hodarchaeales archaeon]